ncbi:hypothetical protein A2363_02420 [Candidatus Gottesmanbacteria bacterium RIFOXYB1_FULL_47_11]|uniref:AI-2E family transporter n=1 Tax=Candidatus Gottesmanbacteria bacterium RIFOXYB1_FULL_47_11 TaxID=1798401 RepID=A0A1F6BEF2_9BACT|nr:MAG: hypothetical protein A2363_02420 [Candidatus Gottesmanbacteria bacterium RIFOXYB1_FULL_47_11]
MHRKIEISERTVIFTLALLAAIWLILQIRDILFFLFIAFLIMTAIFPIVSWLDKYKIPRPVSVFLIYVFMIGFLGISFGSIVPMLVAQTTTLVQTLPGVVARVLPYWTINLQTVFEQIGPISENVLSVTLSIFSNLVATLTVLVLTFYFIYERKNAHTILTDLLGSTMGKRAGELLLSIERRLGAWVRGELLLMTFIGACSYIGLTLLHVDFALPLAIIAGLLEIIPNIGPFLAFIPAVLVALSISPLLALSTAALYLIIQQLENNIFVPMVMKRSVGLSPLITILALMVGGRLGGVAGAILAVPILLVFEVLWAAFLQTKNPS